MLCCVGVLFCRLALGRELSCSAWRMACSVAYVVPARSSSLVSAARSLPDTSACASFCSAISCSVAAATCATRASKSQSTAALAACTSVLPWLTCSLYTAVCSACFRSMSISTRVCDSTSAATAAILSIAALCAALNAVHLSAAFFSTAPTFSSRASSAVFCRAPWFATSLTSFSRFLRSALSCVSVVDLRCFSTVFSIAVSSASPATRFRRSDAFSTSRAFCAFFSSPFMADTFCVSAASPARSCTCRLSASRSMSGSQPV